MDPHWPRRFKLEMHPKFSLHTVIILELVVDLQVTKMSSTFLTHCPMILETHFIMGPLAISQADPLATPSLNGVARLGSHWDIFADCRYLVSFSSKWRLMKNGPVPCCAADYIVLNTECGNLWVMLFLTDSSSYASSNLSTWCALNCSSGKLSCLNKYTMKEALIILGFPCTGLTLLDITSFITN